MSNSKVRYGIISPASIAPRFAEAMKHTDNGTVSAISSRSLEKACRFAQEHAIPQYYDDYHQILNDPDIDAVYLPLVNSLHYPFALEALQAGKHVIVEKPFVTHAADGAHLAQVAKEKGLFLVEAIKTPFLPVSQKIKEIIDSGKYGPVHVMEFRQSYVHGNYADGWNKQKKYGGGVLYGNEAYFFAMAEYYCGKIRSYTASATYGSHDVEDQCAITLVLENNALAINVVSTNVLLKNGLVIHLEKGRIEIPDYWKARTAYIYENNVLKETISFPVDYELQYELQHFNQCILDGLTESPVIPLETSIRYIRICEDLYKSIENS